MTTFTYYNPTKVYFGDQLSKLGEVVRGYGSRALLMYGGGSIKRTGVYDRIVGSLKEAGVTVSEFQGVEPNPQYTTVNRATDVCKANDCDVVLAVGGGSVIDAAKVVTQARFYDGDCWDLVTQKVKAEQGLPLIAVPTMASAGSENDAWAVISNKDTNQKLDPWGESFQPKAVFIDPAITYTVGAYQTAVGAADILSHITDIRYFIKEHKIAFINEMMEAMARNVIKYAPVAIAEPDNEEARENLSWASAMITGGIMDQGGTTDMILHLTEYGIAAFYEIPHGHGIAILMPRWMQYILNEEVAPVFYRFGVQCLEVESGLDPMTGAQKTIDAVSDWLYNKLGLESHLAAFGVEEAKLPEMAVKALRGMNTLHGLTDLTVQDVEKIFRMCM